MVNEVILKTVKMMLKSGIGEEQIKLQLSGYGLSEDDVANLIKEAQGGEAASSPTSAKAVPPSTDTDEDEKELEEVQKDLEAAAQEPAESVRKVEQRVASVSATGVSSQAISELKEDLSELKASANALQTLLKKILDTNREILMNLSKK